MSAWICPEKRRSLHLVLLAVAVLAVFGNTLLNGFVWDDRIFLLGRGVYRNFDLVKIFLSPANDAEYLPLRDLTYALDYAVWGERPFGFHLTSLLLHLGAVWAVYYLVRRLETLFGIFRPGPSFKTGDFAFITAVLFAVHPLQSQSVNFIGGGRNTLLAAFFAFWAAGFYLRSLELSGSKRWALVTFGGFSFLCALLSKATVVTVPLALAVAWFHLYRARREKFGSITTLLPFLLLSAIFYVVHMKIAVYCRSINERLIYNYPLGVKIATATQIPFFYIRKLLLPTGLSPEYDVQFASTFGSLPVLASLVGLGSVTFVFLKWGRKLPAASFATAWFLGTLIPVLNFYVTNPTVADRYAYFPSFGLFLLFAIFMTHTFQDRAQRWIIGVFLALLVIWSAWAMKSNAVWKNEKTLWERAIQISPLQPKGYVNLAAYYFAEGDQPKAFELLEKTRELGSWMYAYRDLYEGYVLAKNGDHGAAVLAYRKALGRKEDFIQALYALAESYEAMGDFEAAVGYYNRTVRVRTNDPGGYRDKSEAALVRIADRIAPKLDALKGRLAANPSDQAARIDLAFKYDQMGMYEQALPEYLEFIKRDQQRWEIFFNLGNVYKKLDKRVEAIHAYRKSLSLNPSHADSWNNLGSVLMGNKEYDQALDAYAKAIAIDPSMAYAHYNMGLTYFFKGERDRALQQLRDTVRNFPVLEPSVTPYLQILGAH